MKVLIADDHPIFRKGLKEIIISGMEQVCVLEAVNGVEAYDLIEKELPKVAIIDIEMPECNGLDLCRKIRDEMWPVKVIFLTMYKEEEVFVSAMDTGANGYILKDHSANEVIQGIRAVLAGERFISPEMRSHLSSANQWHRKKGEVTEAISKLSETELRTLMLVSDNKSSQEIADMLFVTRKSVENYRSRICKKLGLESGNNSLLHWVLENKTIISRIRVEGD